MIILKSKNAFIKVCIYFYDEATKFSIHSRILILFFFFVRGDRECIYALCVGLVPVTALALL